MYQTKQRLNEQSVSSKYTEHLLWLLSLSKSKPTKYRQDMIVQTNAFYFTLKAQPSKRYYLVENIRIIFHQSSRKADPFPHYANSCHQGLNLHFIYKISVQDTPLLSSNKKVIMSPDKIHHTWTEKDPNASTCIIFNYFT